MLYKGYQFRRNKNIVMTNMTGCVEFGYAVKQGAEIPKNAVETSYSWPDGSKVWAEPIALSGHSRTNMAYSADNQRVYLGLNGMVFTAMSNQSKQNVVS